MSKTRRKMPIANIATGVGITALVTGAILILLGEAIEGTALPTIGWFLALLGVIAVVATLLVRWRQPNVYHDPNPDSVHRPR